MHGEWILVVILHVSRIVLSQESMQWQMRFTGDQLGGRRSTRDSILTLSRINYKPL